MRDSIGSTSSLSNIATYAFFHFLVYALCSTPLPCWDMQKNTRQLFWSWHTIMVWMNIPREMHMHRLSLTVSVWASFSFHLSLWKEFTLTLLFSYWNQIAISTDDVYKSGEVVNLVTQELGGKVTRQPGPLPGINTKITAFLDPDGWKTVSFNKSPLVLMS